MSTNRISILLADDTLIAREGWKKILETADDMRVVGEAVMAHETLRKVKDLRPNVLLMDLKWFGDVTAGWTAIREIKASYPKVKIIAITAYENLIRDARLAGADGALTKEFTREELLGLIRDLASRRRSYKVSELEKFDQDNLTSRENEVLLLIAKGYRDKEIAKELGIATTTAKNHVKKILEKLGAKNRTEASNFARQIGLLD